MAEVMSGKEVAQRKALGDPEGETVDAVVTTPVGSEEVVLETQEVPDELKIPRDPMNMSPTERLMKQKEDAYSRYSEMNAASEAGMGPSAGRGVTTQIIQPMQQPGQGYQIPRQGYWQYALKNHTLWGGYGDDIAKMAPLEWKPEKEDTGKIITTVSEGGKKAQMDPREKRALQNQWIQLQNSVKGGQFYNPDTGLKTDELLQKRQRIIDAYIQAGGNPDELYEQGSNVGGFAATKHKPTMDALDDVVWAEQTASDLEQQIKDGSYFSQNKQIWDKVSERVAKVIGDSKGAIADAEKVRIQYLYLPREAQQKYYEAYKRYQNALFQIENKGIINKFNDSQRGKIQLLKNALGQAMSSDSPERFANGLGVLMSLATSTLDELPQGMDKTLDAIKQSWKDFKDKMILDANVDPRTLWGMLKYMHDTQAQRYKANIQERGGEAREFSNIEANPSFLNRTFESQYTEGPYYATPSPNILKDSEISHLKEGGKQSVDVDVTVTPTNQDDSASRFEKLKRRRNRR